MKVPEPPMILKNIPTARPGDICILLGPHDDALSSIEEAQRNLQAHFGGIPHKPVHFTCQRFRIDDPDNRTALIKNLRSAMREVEPISLTAESLYIFQHTFWQSRLLRWIVRLTDALTAFGEILNHTLRDSGASLYFEDEHWYPSMVTALEDIACEGLEDYLSGKANPLPHHLFTATKVIVSEIEEHKQFSILDVIELNTSI